MPYRLYIIDFMAQGCVSLNSWLEGYCNQRNHPWVGSPLLVSLVGWITLGLTESGNYAIACYLHLLGRKCTRGSIGHVNSIIKGLRVWIGHFEHIYDYIYVMHQHDAFPHYKDCDSYIWCFLLTCIKKGFTT